MEDLFASIETDERFSEAVVTLCDGSRLYFVHRVGERRVKAFGPDDASGARHADNLLDRISMFRLNAKHLEVLFDDGTTWEWYPPTVS